MCYCRVTLMELMQPFNTSRYSVLFFIVESSMQFIADKQINFSSVDEAMLLILKFNSFNILP